MGVDEIDKADIFDEYFDDEKPKYIIRNCPAIYGIDDGFLCSYREDDESEKYCYDCTDCILKQIVEKCRERYVGFLEESFIKDEILNLFQIEEVDTIAE